MQQVYAPQGLFESGVAGLHRCGLKTFLKPVFSPRFSISFQRRWLAALARIALLVPSGVEITRGQVGGVAGEWIRARHSVSPSTVSSNPCLLYLHGGAYCIGSAATHRALTARLALATGWPVFSLDYRLAPEHPYPAALEDALAAFCELQAQGPVVLAGDSAGGGLALATAMALRDRGGTQPASLLLLSPWADVAVPDSSPSPPPGEAMLSADWARACSAHYRNGRPAGDPGVSPLRGDLHELPPTLIQVGTDEMLFGQALALHDALKASGVHVRCEVTQQRWHVFQLQAGILPSANEAIVRLASFAHAHLPRLQDGAEQHEVVILGAGMSGLCTAIGLQKAGIHDFVILEKQSGLGGTWWDNRYPGAHVDVPAPAYSFSFAPNPGWTRRFPSASEIQHYMRALAERHGLLERIRFGTRLTEAHFDEGSGRWRMTTDGGSVLRSRFFVCSTGPLSQVRWPDISGLASFKGEKLHSARWDASAPLQGQRIAVIGSGSTASQLVPPLAAKASQLHVFQRTANWVLPRIDRPYNAVDRWLAGIGLYNRGVRWSWVQLMELGRRGFDDDTLTRSGLLKAAAAHRQQQVPDPALRQRLTPDYPLGCKRIIYSNDFYPALSQPNVELVTERIERITERGVVTADGMEREIDVLVCATGFDTANLLSSVRVAGLGGLSLQEAWAHGPQAYYGLTVSGFPNLFLMLGPNTGSGHASTLLYIEPGVAYAIRCMQAVRQGQHQSIELRDDVMQSYNQRLQARLNGSVWSMCRSWYRADNGRIWVIFPGFTREYQRAVRRVNLRDYELR